MSKNKVIYLSHYAKQVQEGEKEPLTKDDIDCSDMLRAIADQEPMNAFVICWPNDGKMPTYHSSTGDIQTVLFRLQTFIHGIFNEEIEYDRD